MDISQKSHYIKFRYILIALMVLLPNKYLGEESAAAFLLGIGLIYLAMKFNKYEYKLQKQDKVYLFIMVTMVISSMVSIKNTYSTVKALGNLALYINLPVYYIIFINMKKEKANIYNIITVMLAIIALLSVILEGALYKNRISGNVGYANSFALILLIGLYSLLQQQLCRKDKALDYMDLYIKVIYLLAMLYTGSRTTLIFSIPYFILDLYFSIKNHEKVTSIYALIIALVLYIIINKGGIGGIIIAPIILGISSSLYKTLKPKIFNKATSMALIIMVILAFSLNLNTFNRIKNISINNASLNERFVIFKDAINTIGDNALGHGAGSFQYNQYKDATANYDAKYIHNSFIQAYYDLGFIGGTAFLAMFLWGGVMLFRGRFSTLDNRSNKRGRFSTLDLNWLLSIVMYFTLYLHSLLDFDFSFANIALIPVILVALREEENIKENKKAETTIEKQNNLTLKQRILAITAILASLISFYISLNGALNFKASKALALDQVSSYKTFFQVVEPILIKDYEFYKAKGDICFQHYKDKGEIFSLKEAIRYYKKAEALNPIDPILKENLDYFYEKLR